MRWKTKRKPQLGDKRSKKVFLFLPKSFGGYNNRWLEFAWVKQEYRSCTCGYDALETEIWDSYRFLRDEEIKEEKFAAKA